MKYLNSNDFIIIKIFKVFNTIVSNKIIKIKILKLKNINKKN